jgi:hypothetical protein
MPSYGSIITRRESLHFNADEVGTLVLRPDEPTRDIHRKAGSIGSGHAAEDQDFLHQVTAATADARAVLIAGPANAKTELVKHIHRHDPKLIERLAGIETVDHSTDASLVAHARHYFKAADRMLPA